MRVEVLWEYVYLFEDKEKVIYLMFFREMCRQIKKKVFCCAIKTWLKALWIRISSAKNNIKKTLNFFFNSYIYLTIQTFFFNFFEFEELSNFKKFQLVQILLQIDNVFFFIFFLPLFIKKTQHRTLLRLLKNLIVMLCCDALFWCLSKSCTKY